MKSTTILIHAAWLLGVTAAFLFAQGELDPSPDNGAVDPEGNPQPSMKTLDQIEPRTPLGVGDTLGGEDGIYRITRSGSYYLTGDVIGEQGRHGIVIAASNVDLDLNGFTVLGGPDTGSGIVEGPEPITNTSIRNGTVSGWGGSGIDLQGASSYTEVRAVRALQNEAHGFKINGNLKAITATAVANGADGFHSVDGSRGGVWIGAIASDNGGIGIKAGEACTLKDCTASGNEGDGITVGEAGMLGNCTAAFNQSAGIVAGARVTIDHCSASSNSQAGIRTGEGCVVTESTVGGSPIGIELGDASRVRGCVFNGGQLGIRVGSNSRVVTTTLVASGIGSTALEVVGAGNRIESSHVAVPEADSVGIAAEIPENLFIGLSATGAGVHYQIPAGAARGPFVTGEEVQGNASPDANFSF